MPYSISSDQKYFFQKHGWIQFESLIPAEKSAEFGELLRSTLAQRMGVPKGMLGMNASSKVYSKGRDVWRDHEELRRFSCGGKYAQIAGQLVGKRQLRIAWDQSFLYQGDAYEKKGSKSFFSSMQGKTLEEISPVQHVEIACLFSFEGRGSELKPLEEGESFNPFACGEGEGIFLRPDVPLDFSGLSLREGCVYLLVVYCGNPALYIHSTLDPNTHELKNLDYVFGDSLSQKTHPVVYRREL